jgi:hypothetical protein
MHINVRSIAAVCVFASIATGLQACASSRPDCDTKLEPINVPAESNDASSVQAHVRATGQAEESEQ